MCWHVHRCLCRNCILAPPQTCHCLLLCVELQTRLAVEGVRATARNRFLVSCEGEHGELALSAFVRLYVGWKKTYRHRNGHVDTDLTGLNLTLEATSSSTRACEDGSAVAVFIGVDQVNGLIDGLDVETHEDRAEDLFCVALHMWLDVRDDGGTNLGGKVSHCLL
jgi:hypothetical protein